MKIVHCLPSTAHGPLCYEDLSAGGRGVTGSEQAMLYLARAQAGLGHRVVVYLPTGSPGRSGENVELIDIRSVWPRLRRMDHADVVISWTTADPLRAAPASALRVLSIQINDWLPSVSGYDSHTDVYVSVSKAHQQALWREIGNPGGVGKSEIIPNGVDLARFAPLVSREEFRCAYLSSPDRGLHWLLAMWPEIRFAFPRATLHVFYEIEQWFRNAMLHNNEVAHRAWYVSARLGALAKHGVVARGALPPGDLARELLRTDVVLYPCDTVRFTEGFGVAVLEACAAGAMPVITDCDAFGEVYGSSGAMVVPRTGPGWVDDYLDTTLKLLADRDEIERRRALVVEFAAGYDWVVVARQWQAMIDRRIEAKRAVACVL